MQTQVRPQVLIVGAGSAGLIAALALIKAGVTVRVLDKAHEHHRGIRATAIQPRSLELLKFLGVLDDVLAISTPPLMLALHGPDNAITSVSQWSESEDPAPSIPYPALATVSQARMEDVFRAHLAARGCHIELGREVASIEGVEGDAVTVQVTGNDDEKAIVCDYLIAADGAKGKIRHMLGLSFLGESNHTDRMLTANVNAYGIDHEHWHRWGTKDLAVMLKPILPAPNMQLQSLGPNLPTELPTDTAGLQRLLDSVNPSKAVKLEEGNWISEWRANARMVDQFSKGRVFLVGDSAHIHSPAGGQGLNTGVQDSGNIAWKLAAVCKGEAPSGLLESYGSERMPVVAKMLDLVKELHVQSFGPAAFSAYDEGKTETGVHRPKKLLQFGVNYRWSGVVLDERFPAKTAQEALQEWMPLAYDGAGDGVRAGDRAPDAPGLKDAETGQESTLFEIFAQRVMTHTMLVFPGSVEAAIPKFDVPLAGSVVLVLKPGTQAPQVAVDAMTVIDASMHAHHAYDVAEGGHAIVIVRPDGVIGAYCTSGEGVGKYAGLLRGAM